LLQLYEIRKIIDEKVTQLKEEHYQKRGHHQRSTKQKRIFIKINDKRMKYLEKFIPSLPQDNYFPMALINCINNNKLGRFINKYN